MKGMLGPRLLGHLHLGTSKARRPYGLHLLSSPGSPVQRPSLAIPVTLASHVTLLVSKMVLEHLFSMGKCLAPSQETL